MSYFAMKIYKFSFFKIYTFSPVGKIAKKKQSEEVRFLLIRYSK